MTLATLREEAMRLAPPERLTLAASLAASVDTGDVEELDASKAWADELGARVDEVTSGRDPGRPWSDVRAALLARKR
jgi:putative addiction module component (TIGR02574 family)